MDLSRILVRITAGLMLATLAACGGGGDGGGGGGTTAVVYSGVTTAAVITTTNASTITANVVGGTDAGSVIAGVSVESSSTEQSQGTGPARLARHLGQLSRGIVTRAGASGSQQAIGGAVITEGCDSGSIQLSGTPNPDGTGTFSFTFINCTFAGITIDGPATLRVDATVIIPPDVIPTDFTLSFARLTLRGTVSIDAGGSIRFQEVGNTLTMTLNLDEQNNNTGKMRKTVSLVINDVFNDIVNPTSFTETLTGQVFHSDYGFVTVNTLSAFVFGPPIQLFPDSGQMTLTGAPEGVLNRAIRVTALASPPAALPATLMRLALDLDGNGAFEINDVRLKWTELGGPVGADLGDTDFDGMHNSWETVNGLLPDVDDAGDNKDGDASTNLQEYLAGTDPSI